jgi:transcriptional regulator with AAA-type ATPase domain/pSer/pThr/pTyr-binding forkhead associated (FHA) protein
MPEAGTETERLHTPEPRRGSWQLLVLVGDRHRVEVLPERGSVTVGRGGHADIRVEEPAISRRHFTLHLEEGLRLEDLGSANGTVVRGQVIQSGESVELRSGDAIEIGRALLVVQRVGVAPLRAIRIKTHEDIEERIDEECRLGSDRNFALMHLVCPPGDGQLLRSRLLDALEPGEILGTYGPDEYEILALDIQPEDVEQRVKQLAGEGMEIGVACHPRDGRSAAELVERASPRAPRAPSGGIVEDLGPVVDRVAQSNMSVLLVGETGTGKGVLALELHRRSPRREGPFVPLHCAEFPESLLEAELFGYERGAFSGAARAKPGLIESASGGTLFLDEVAEIPVGIQVKLLRVLEGHEVRRLGAVRSRPIDLRIIAASSRDLEEACARGEFRPDLFFRLNGLPLVLPPLRERPHEIEPLARKFIDQYSRAQNVPAPTLTPDALKALRRHPWPGNVRELRNVIERAVVHSRSGLIGTEHLPSERTRVVFVSASVPRASATRTSGVDPEERERIAAALRACGGNQSRAAKMLGISRRTLVTRLAQHGFPRPLKKT